ncbi:WXG100 family type VII secretion target, partial [Streptomyces sp. SID625]|nr:WXG100 family type VII secretion target [Streptomyces sp. SID625]
MPDYTDGVIDVHYSTVANAIEEMQQQTQAISQTLATLDEELAPLKGGWSGDDKTEYVSVQQQWNAAVEQMRLLLSQNRDLVHDVADGHRRDEHSSAEMWSGVRA